jgi:hypothetical protein
MEVRFNLTDDEFMEGLQKKLQVKTAAEVVKQALTVMNWAVNEFQNGRVILSSDEKGQNVHRLVMPAFERLRSSSAAQAPPVPAAATSAR